MPFKIVQTIEGGETCLCIVPSKWESNGTLYWPKKHLVVKLSLQEDSIPSDNWQRINCIKKRQFQTYGEACEELKRMEDHSDTEVDEVYMSRISGNKRCQPTTNTPTKPIIDFNHFAEQQTFSFTNSESETNVSNQETLPDATGRVVILNAEEVVKS